MSSIVAFVVVLVVSMIDSSQAVTCYQCNYTRESNIVTLSSCGGYPMNHSTKNICSSPVCSWTLSNYAYPTSYIVVQFDCLNTAGVDQSDLCALYRTQYAVQDYTNYCCYNTSSSGSPYYVTTCFCQSDYCQENIPASVGTPTFTPSPPSDSATPLLDSTSWTMTDFGTQTVTPAPSDSAMSLLNPSCWIITMFGITAVVTMIGS